MKTLFINVFTQQAQILEITPNQEQRFSLRFSDLSPTQLTKEV